MQEETQTMLLGDGIVGVTMMSAKYPMNRRKKLGAVDVVTKNI